MKSSKKKCNLSCKINAYLYTIVLFFIIFYFIYLSKAWMNVNDWWIHVLHIRFVFLWVKKTYCMDVLEPLKCHLKCVKYGQILQYFTVFRLKNYKINAKFLLGWNHHFLTNSYLVSNILLYKFAINRDSTFFTFFIILFHCNEYLFLFNK